MAVNWYPKQQPTRRPPNNIVDTLFYGYKGRRVLLPHLESKIEEDLGDLLIRLDEFQHLLAMSQNDTATCLFQQVPSITQSFPNVERIFHKIDRLEVMVAKIKTNMENMDKLLTQAENTVAGSGIRTFMPMLFGAARPPAAAFMPPMSSNPSEIRVFSTDEFYPKIMKP
eukprot:TCALIF_10556-PA protein Name:"Similar to BLOC1S4 Biogenesis of lysosome-related organelles complex 1 subunit 4 (Homo sapiens)" AED:0.03 eAED:0.03 QI:0/0.5/0.6/0.6/1/1/5/1508/168